MPTIYDLIIIMSPLLFIAIGGMIRNRNFSTSAISKEYSYWRGELCEWKNRDGFANYALSGLFFISLMHAAALKGAFEVSSLLVFNGGEGTAHIFSSLSGTQLLAAYGFLWLEVSLSLWILINGIAALLQILRIASAVRKAEYKKEV